MVSALIFIVFVLIAAALIIIWVKRQNSAPDTYPAGSVLTLHITGMHCEKCSASVMQALNAVNGVHAEVDLKNNFRNGQGNYRFPRKPHRRSRSYVG